jgi:hypothetical protein
MDITVSFCGSLYTGTTFTGMFTDCDFSGIVRAVNSETTTCPDEQLTVTYRRVPAGTYLIPIVDDPEGTPGAYTITVTGTTCADPAVANDECDGGISLTPGPGCSPTLVDVLGATESLPAAECSGFTGTADEDVWFSFVATTTTVQIRVQGSEGFDAVLEVFEGDCGVLSSLGCLDGTLDGGLEAAQVTDLVLGNTYYVRVYDWYVGLPVTTEVDICIVEVPDVAANDDCPGTALVMGTECVTTLGTVADATQSSPAILCNGFTGNANDDVWHSFVATAENVVVAAQCGTDFDMVLELLSGACGSGTSLACADATVENEVEQIAYSGLMVGTTYYVRLYPYAAEVPTDPNYAICVFGFSAPVNDECAAAEIVPVNLPAECPVASVIGNTAFAEISSGDPSCDATTEGYQDVWYTFNSLGNTAITVTFENISMEDAAVVITEACGSLTDIACEIGPADPFDVTVEPNTDYFVRVYNNLQFGAGGEFALCISGAISTQVDEDVVTSPWSVFPNPNDGRFQLTNSGAAMDALVELFDATGRVVLNERVVMPAGGLHTFDRAGRLAPGTYALRITSGDQRFDQRVVVQ